MWWAGSLGSKAHTSHSRASFARGAGVPLRVEGQAEGLAEQARQPLGKGGGFGDDLHLVQGEPVAVKEHPAGFRLGGALVPQFSPAQFRLHISRKGHGVTSFPKRRPSVAAFRRL